MMLMHHLPAAAERRPKSISLEAAKAQLNESLASLALASQRRTYFEDKWLKLESSMTKDDQLWLFETSGIGNHKRRGIAREHRGQVVDILVFP